MIEKTRVRYGSVCSGIEAATVAWHGLGWTPAWFSEIEKFPCAVLAHHFPEVANLGDMLGVEALVRSGAVEAPEILVGGTPCQSFSVAGLRKGLNDSRGQLTKTYIEVLDAIDDVRRAGGKTPAICLWENVPGVLSDKTNGFGNLLAGLVGADNPLLPPGGKPATATKPAKSGSWPNCGVVSGPKRKAAWRILDAQFYGVPQRRRRVFLISSAGADVAALAEILLEQTGEGRNPEAVGEAREKTAANAGGGVAAVTSNGQQIVGKIYAGTHGQSACGNTGINAGHVTAQPIVVDFGRTADRIYINATKSVTLSSQGGGLGAKSGLYAFSPSYIVRRLTPVECELLQGFSKNYTLIPVGKGKLSADGPRYKALGNSFAVPVVKWIGERMIKYLGWDL